MTITANYPKTKFIRQGSEKIKTCYITEAQYPGGVMNVQDMSEYDQGDTDLGVFIDDINLNTNAGTQVSGSQKAFYVPMNDCAGVEALMTEAGVGTISAGAYVKANPGRTRSGMSSGARRSRSPRTAPAG
jgi:hypothetical protein